MTRKQGVLTEITDFSKEYASKGPRPYHGGVAERRPPHMHVLVAFGHQLKRGQFLFGFCRLWAGDEAGGGAGDGVEVVFISF